MKINQAAFFLFFSCLLLLTLSSSSSDTSFLSDHTGHGLVQNIRRAGHGDGSSGGSGLGGSHGSGDGDSSTRTQPGRPLNGAGTANLRNHHRRGAAINSPACNFSLLTVAISLSLCVSFYIWS